MVAPMKHNGLDDVNRLQRRARRLYALERISQEDFEYLEKHLQALEQRIIEMREKTTNRETPF